MPQSGDVSGVAVMLLREVRSRAPAGAVEMKIHCANSASTSAGRNLLSQRLRFASLWMIDYEGARIRNRQSKIDRFS